MMCLRSRGLSGTPSHVNLYLDIILVFFFFLRSFFLIEMMRREVETYRNAETLKSRSIHFTLSLQSPFRFIEEKKKRKK